jgi:8-amino-7-oxononanoate synthase
MKSLNLALEFYKSDGTYRTLHATHGLSDFSSNDYLGLSFSPKVRAKLRRALANGCPLGASGSRLLSGQTEFHERVESFLQSAFHAPSALIFSSGFMANLGVISAFSTINAHFFSDEENHASLIDGMKISNAPKSVYRHNDLADLKSRLSKSSSQTKVIVTEGVFSMSGDIAPLVEILSLAKKFNTWLVVDEAHSTGVFGKAGLGILSDLTLHYPLIVSIHTGGKALGGQGAFVLSSNEFRHLMVNCARSFIFSTALSPLSALQMQFALEEVIANPADRKRLLSLAVEVRKKLTSFGLTVNGKSQIIPVVLGSNERVINASQYLQRQGFDVRPIRSPSVSRGKEQLRITLKSFIPETTVQKFIESMEAMPL